jgi:putative endonuclease
MFWMYILHNPETDRFYIGSTSDIERRLTQHTKGYTRTTRVLKTFKLIYKEEFRTLTEARLREKQLKSYKSKKYIKWLISK